jgi:hypothetical protein
MVDPNYCGTVRSSALASGVHVVPWARHAEAEVNRAPRESDYVYDTRRGFFVARPMYIAHISCFCLLIKRQVEAELRDRADITAG